MGHSKLSAKGTAMYPYVSTSCKIASLSKGEHSHSESNLFQGDFPSQLIVGLVSSEAFSGNYKKSPFNFQPFDCNFLALYVDGQSYPAKPLQPNFTGKNYVQAYRTWSAFRNDANVSYAAYGGGYAIYVLNVDDDIDFNTKRRGDCRLEIRFGTPYRKALQFSCTASFLGSYTWINPALSCYNEQFGTGKTIETSPSE
jgi:hypothetical protein